jgi:hypothetical protein
MKAGSDRRNNKRKGRQMTEKRKRQPAPIAGGAGAVHAAEREAAEQSTGELVGGIAADLGVLVRKEMELARHELIEALVARLKSAAALMTAGLLGLMAVLFGALAVADLLANVMPVWLSRGVVCVAFGGVALAALLYGGKRVVRPPLTPVETKRTVKEDVEWAKTQLKR